VSAVQRWTVAAIVAASLAGAWLYLYAGRPFYEDAESRFPDVYIEQPRWQLFDATGHPGRQLRARRLEQWPGEPGARLLDPDLEITDRRQQRWLASASRGRIAADRTSLLLEGDVRLRRGNGKQGPVVQTQKLRIDGKGDVIETDQPVLLLSANWHFTASGLYAELGSQRLQLLGNVRGTHD